MIILPFLMSLGLLALLGWDVVFGPEHLPLHDEAFAQHLGILLLIGQVPLILWNFLRRRRFLLGVLQAACLALAVYLVGLSEAAERAKVQARIDAAQPFPGGETAVRALAEAPDPSLAGLGAVQSIEFDGIDSIGWDIYAVTFEKGVRHVHLFLSRDGRLLGSTVADTPSGCVSTEIYDCRYLDRPYRGIRRRG